MKNCTYTYNNVTYNSYQELVTALLNTDTEGFRDLLFNKTDIQDVTYDLIKSVQSAKKYVLEKSTMIDGGAEWSSEEDAFTTQTFIDSAYFKIFGEAPMFQLSVDDFLKKVQEERIKKEGISEEEAESWGKTVKEKWNEIANDAKEFHSMMSLPSNEDLYFWSKRVHKTSFAAIAEKVQEAEKNIYFQVMKRNGAGKLANSKGGRVIKGINLEAQLKDIVEPIMGHIDYVVVKDNGEIELFNIKTSTEPYYLWPKAKKEKYRYQMALLKQMLAQKGIDPRKIRVNIVPVQLKYDSNFEMVEDIFVQDSVALDVYDGKYIFTDYDKVAEQFITSTSNFKTVSSETIIKATTVLQKIFPGKNILAQGIQKNAQEWVRQNWYHCSPEVLPNNSGYKLTLPESGEEIIVKDTRKGEKNAEFVKIIEEKIGSELEEFTVDKGAKYLIDDIKNSLKQGFFNSSMKGPRVSYLQQQFTKYFEAKHEDEDGKFNYDWELVESSTLTSANLIAFRHKTTGQLDVFAISGVDPNTKYSFKNGRDNLLGAYIPDLNNYNFEMESNYGNMDAIRAMVLLNEAFPEIQGKVKLGQLKVIGLNSYSAKKGVFYEFDTLLKQWNTIIQVVNKNNPKNPINNNFKELGIQVIAPEEVVYQIWLDTLNDVPESSWGEIRDLKDILEQKHNINGPVIDGLMSVATIEGKIEKLNELLETLQKLANDQGIITSNATELRNATFDANKKRAAVAKLYMATSRALAMYNGDISLNNEEISTMHATMIKSGSVGNSSIRRVAVLTHNTIDQIRAKILEKYVDKVSPIFQEFYEEGGYTKLLNATVGNQASMYKNLYEVDENGNMGLTAKNPYNPSSELKDFERKFLKKILYEFYKVRCEMSGIPLDISGIDDPKLIKDMPKGYLFIPLQQASSATKSQNIGSALKNAGKKIMRLITSPTEVFEESLGNLTREEAEYRDSLIGGMTTYNHYVRSYMSDRDAQIASKGVEYFETNMENVFVDFLSKQVQTEEFNKLLIRVKGIELALTLRGIAEGDTEAVDKTIKEIEDFAKVNIYGSSIMEKSSKKIDAWLQPLRRAVSMYYIAASPTGMVRDTIQGLEANFINTLIKFQTDVGAEDVAFAYKEVFKDGLTNIGTLSKLNQFNIKFGLSNFDAAKVGERIKTGRGGIYNLENVAFWTLRAPDYLNRMTLFVAKMKKDGCYEAYSLNEDGRLVYNWRKDKRFSEYAAGNTSHPDYNKQKSLYFSLIREFNTATGSDLTYTDDLPDAYTPSEVRAIKTLGDSIYGNFDQSGRAKYENMAIGRNFIFFSTWMNGMVDNYFKSRQISESELRLEQETDYNGNPLFFKDNFGGTTTEDTGVPVLKHVPIMVQGIFGTFGTLIKELHGENWDFKKFSEGDVWNNEIHRRNLKKALTDFTVFMLLTALFKMFLTPKYQKHKVEADGRRFMENAIMEILYKGGKTSFDTFKGPLAILQYLGESTNPATYKLQSRVLKDLTNFAIGEKTVGQIAMGSNAFFRSAQDSYRMWLRDTKNNV